ncbi:serine/threonine protein kinase [Pendulispora albinea]|uniref:Serine/threonine protein kinase n=1 Tax=Pendulispora albinea TaxID=2741071 RepID=A0ABZ2LMU0_9BACT
MQRLAENDVIGGRFRLNRLLGRGGMGSVWHATHLGLDIPCAIKFIEGEFAAQADAQQRFEREAKAAAQLRSPHVVQILDHGVCQGRPYIAMELLDGEDLGKRLKRKGRLSASEVIGIVQQICRGLTKAHQEGIVHRDLKPDNVFLVPDDDRELVKILDFGIAKSLTSDEANQQTRVGALLGTPYYMSPEQAQGSRSVDHRSDLWSLAVICFYCLVGKRPFPSPSLAEVLMQIIVHDLPIPSQLAPDLPHAFDGWWLRAAARDPGQRFQNAREFADALAEALASASVASAPAMAAPVDPRGRTMPMASFNEASIARRPATGTSVMVAMNPTPPAMGAVGAPPAGAVNNASSMAGYTPMQSAYGAPPGAYAPMHSPYGAPPQHMAAAPAAAYSPTPVPNQSTGAPTTRNTGESPEPSAEDPRKITPNMLIGGGLAFVFILIAIIAAQYWVNSAGAPSERGTTALETRRDPVIKPPPPPTSFVPGPVLPPEPPPEAAPPDAGAVKPAPPPHRTR